MNTKTTTKYPGVKRLEGGKYEIRVKVVDARTGRQKDIKKVVTASGGADAAALREELRQEALVTEPTSQERVRLDDFATSWLATKLRQLKPSTADRYASALDLHILPHLGSYFIDGISPGDVRRWLQAQKGKPATINGRLRILKTLLADATFELGISRSPAERISALRDKRAEDDPNRLQLDELALVLEDFEKSEPRWFPLVLCISMTGVRFGEATALKWRDIDFKRSTIHIRRSQWKQQVTDTKTGSSRSVPMPPRLKEVFRGLRRGDNDWVFTNANGNLFHTASLQKPIRRVLERVGLGRRQTTHGFRRTFNNILRTHASGDVVRSMTGHVTEAMTRHYSHVEDSEKQAAVAQAFASMKVEGEVEGLVEGPSNPTKKAD